MAAGGLVGFSGTVATAAVLVAVVEPVHTIALQSPWIAALSVLSLATVVGFLSRKKRGHIDQLLPKQPIAQSYEITFNTTGGVSLGPFGPEEPTNVSDFDVQSANPVDFKAVFNGSESTITIYSIDIDRQAVSFVEAPYSAIDASKRPFFYQAQRDLATKAYLVPFAEVVALSKAIMAAPGAPKLSRTMFLQSTGRCGSTLLSKVLSSLAGVYSVSENDFYSHVTSCRAVHASSFSRATAVELLRAGTVLLRKSIEAALPNVDVVAIKHRGFATMISDLCHEAVPEAKQVFLYRNALDTVDSYCMAFASSLVNRIARKIRLDSKLIFNKHNIERVIPTIAPLANDKTFSFETIYDLGAIGLMSMAWLSIMDAAQRFEPSFHAFLRYEDLVESRETLVLKLLQKCGFAEHVAVPDATSLEKVFSTDAHGENATTSSKRFVTGQGRMFVSPADASRVEALLASHKSISTGDFKFAETLSA